MGGGILSAETGRSQRALHRRQHRKNTKLLERLDSPRFFERYLIPYTGQTNVKFDYLMDCLNDFLQKKDLGAFFTPEPYAEKARELLAQAISRVPSENDYVVIDRCAGTGNLERGPFRGYSVTLHRIDEGVLRVQGAARADRLEGSPYHPAHRGQGHLRCR